MQALLLLPWKVNSRVAIGATNKTCVSVLGLPFFSVEKFLQFWSRNANVANCGIGKYPVLVLQGCTVVL